MKQKYLLEKQEDSSLVIREYGELEEGVYSLLCEEKFNYEGLLKVIGDESELLDFLRTDNMFPPFSYMTKIREAVKGLYSNGSDETHAEIIFDEAVIAKREREADEESFFDEDELLDDILDGTDDDFDALDDDLGDIDSSASLKVDEDTDLDVDI
eukprot:TRINITY_DN13616_c0_g1_i2.p2 TRINITY_DN13616_c0_g1~~TRINITY_DN13616_c0_g1_i2.p2  ORF type:complete len:155 (+),score=36.14 TRINITY_DN13616_c0_g1_i2:137-601(+)